MKRKIFVFILSAIFVSCNRSPEHPKTDLFFFDAIGKVKEIAYLYETVFGGNEETIMYWYGYPNSEMLVSGKRAYFNQNGRLVKFDLPQSLYTNSPSEANIERFEDSIQIHVKTKIQLFNVKISLNNSVLHYYHSDSLFGAELPYDYEATFITDNNFHVPKEIKYDDLKISGAFERIKGKNGKDSAIIYRSANNEITGKIFYIRYDSVGNWIERAILYYLPDKRSRVKLDRREIVYFEE
jgi:hypothetical protein